MWRVAIVDAISETAEMEQKCQTASIIDIDVEKIEKDGDVLMRQLDHDQARVYVRDATNFKLIRLHQPAASIVTAEQTLDDIQHDITTAKTKSEVVDVDTMVSEDVTAFNPLFDGHFGHLVDAVDHQHKFPDNSKTTGSNVSSHTATSSEDCDCEPSSASTATHTSSDSGDEILDLFTPMKTMKTEAYLHTMFSTSAVRLRNPTARETLRRRLMETDAKKHGMFPSHPIFKQPEEELDGLFDTRYTVHPY
ncbi:hypothetical protein P3T76_001677 [Phytophthora citrophthora]|uniref:Uncharacterized protein n=1 Tax=Phytophthora citrophthora TaxID=4793 RepID=A0AAD9GZF2_9STRA|nr:hypothetical protein P3T76_001677 [Phytophthora citrophthora]